MVIIVKSSGHFRLVYSSFEDFSGLVSEYHPQELLLYINVTGVNYFYFFEFAMNLMNHAFLFLFLKQPSRKVINFE